MMHNWFECKIKYQKIDEATGKDKTIKESYLIDAVSFTEAEARAYKILEEEIGQEFIITNINPVNINDVFFDEDGEIWYKCKVVYIDADPSNGKEKKTGTFALAYANSIKDACEKLEKHLSEVLIPWEVKSIAETNIFDVFPYNAEEAAERKVEGMTPVAEFENKNAIEDFEQEMNEETVYDADEEDEEAVEE